jgi:DNA-binding response OmpR family regulator
MNSARPAAQGSDAGRQPAPLRILIVEDEMLPAMLLEAAVIDAGHTARKAARLPRAIETANAEHFDAAVLDVNLAGEPVFPLAALLRERGVPFLFASGYGEAGVPREYRDCMVLQKPYSQDDFNSALRTLLRDPVVEPARLRHRW